MLKCKCKSCGIQQVYESHKEAWFDGWNFLGENGYLIICFKCFKKPYAKPSVSSEMSYLNNINNKGE